MRLVPQPAFSKAFLPTRWPETVFCASADTPRGTLLAMPNHAGPGFIVLHVDADLQSLGGAVVQTDSIGAILQDPSDPHHFLIQAWAIQSVAYHDSDRPDTIRHSRVSHPEWYAARLSADGAVAVEQLAEWADYRVDDMEVVRVGDTYHWLAVRLFSPTSREELQAREQGLGPKPQLCHACTKGLELPSFTEIATDLPIDHQLRMRLAMAHGGKLVFTYIIADRLFWLGSLDTTTRVLQALPFKVRGFTGGQYEVMSLDSNAKGEIQMVFYYFNGKLKKETRDHGHWIVTFGDIHDKLKPTRLCEDRSAYCLNHIGQQVNPEHYYSIWTSGFLKNKMEVRMQIRNTATGEDRLHTLPGNPDRFFPEGMQRIGGKTYVYGYDGKGQTLWEWVAD